jgi:hypothetical protein
MLIYKHVQLDKPDSDECRFFAELIRESHFNEAPEGFREVPYSEVAPLFCYTPLYTANKQIHPYKEFETWTRKGHRIEGRGMIPVKLDYFHNKQAVGTEVYRERGSDEYKFRFYLCGCEHDWIRQNVGNCLNTYTCSKCGYKETIDSSD